MKRYAHQLFFVSSLLFAASAIATPTCAVSSSKQKLYRLDLTVPATFCMGPKGKSDPSCKNFPKDSLLQLHGLWPNYTKGYPEGKCSASECPIQSDANGKYCAYPKPKGLYESDVWKTGHGYMAGAEKCLERHEWVKHGTCSPMEPTAYFGWALETTKHISETLKIPADTPITRTDFDAMIAKNAPELAGAVRLQCSGKKYVSGLYVLYDWGNTPGSVIQTTSGKNSFGNCGKILVFPSKP